MKRLKFDQSLIDKKAHQMVDKCVQFQNNEIDLKEIVNAIISEIVRPTLGSEPDLWWWDDVKIKTTQILDEKLKKEERVKKLNKLNIEKI